MTLRIDHTNIETTPGNQKTVPSSEEVMLEQIFVNDEQNCLKKDRELFREYEGKQSDQVLLSSPMSLLSC